MKTNREIIEATGMTCPAIAQTLGYSVSYIKDLRSCRYPMSPQMQAALMDIADKRREIAAKYGKGKNDE